MSENSNKVLIGLLVGGALALLLCCGVGFGVLYWLGSNEEFQQGFQEGFAEELAAAGGDEFARQVRVEVEDNPVIVEHIGTITDFEHDFGMSADEPGEDTYVFHLTGDKGSGTLRADCITVDADHEDVPRAELIMDSGESFQLYPSDPLK